MYDRIVRVLVVKRPKILGHIHCISIQSTQEALLNSLFHLAFTALSLNFRDVTRGGS